MSRFCQPLKRWRMPITKFRIAMKHALYLCLLLPTFLLAQITDTDGDWAAHYATLANTPEAELMVRTGDIDNLGFGWAEGYDPFSGNSTRAHAFPWTVDTLDPSGTDRIMVITSYVGTPPSGIDGYTNRTDRPENDVRPITLTFDPVEGVNAATLQLFVDDFQAPIWKANYQVFLDGIRINVLEQIINELRQTGPIGKMITYSLPDKLLYLLDDGSLAIEFDDFETGAGDGYAIDFIKLLINPKETLDRNAVVEGKVTDAGDGSALAGVIVSTSYNLSDTTDAEGNYRLEKLSPGINQLTTYAPGYGSASATIDISDNQTITVNFSLVTPAPELTYASPSAGALGVDTAAVIKLVFDQHMDTATFTSSALLLSDDKQNITGTFTTIGDTLIFVPAHLDERTEYFVTVTTQLHSAAGIPLAADVQFGFSTEPATTATQGAVAVPALAVYPNPLRDNILRFDAPQQVTAYRLLNQYGQVLQDGPFVSSSVTVPDHLAPGMYYLQLLGDGAQVIGLGRFVK